MANEKRLIDTVKARVVAQRIYSDPVLIHAILNTLNNTPTVDAVEVVRCKDCKYFNGESCSNSQWWDDDYTTWVKEEDFCSYGERRDGE